VEGKGREGKEESGDPSSTRVIGMDWSARALKLTGDTGATRPFTPASSDDKVLFDGCFRRVHLLADRRAASSRRSQRARLIRGDPSHASCTGVQQPLDPSHPPPPRFPPPSLDLINLLPLPLPHAQPVHRRAGGDLCLNTISHPPHGGKISLALGNTCIAD
jgi:hypothetical protein